MADRIYTQADYDKVTDLYNNYQNSKDRYTPEQQQKIESAFNNAWTSVSNWIESSKNRIADMYLDSNWNTVQVYWDWRSEIVQYAPVKNTNRQRVSTTPKWNPNPNPNNQNSDLIYMWNDDAWNPIYINRQNASSYLWWDFDKYWLIWPDNDQVNSQNVPNPTPVNTNNNRNSNNDTYNPWPVTSFVNNIKSVPTRVEWAIDTLKATPQFVKDVSNTVNSYNQMTDWNWIQWIWDNIKWAINLAGSLPWTLKSANNMLEWINKTTNNKLTTDAVRRLLSRWYRMWSDWTIYYPDWRVFTKL